MALHQHGGNDVYGDCCSTTKPETSIGRVQKGAHQDWEDAAQAWYETANGYARNSAFWEGKVSDLQAQADAYEMYLRRCIVIGGQMMAQADALAAVANRVLMAVPDDAELLFPQRDTVTILTRDAIALRSALTNYRKYKGATSE